VRRLVRLRSKANATGTDPFRDRDYGSVLTMTRYLERDGSTLDRALDF
jgi:hypothetical protein